MQGLDLAFFIHFWQKGAIFVPNQQPKKLNDTQIAELVMKHANGTSISALSKEYGIDWKTTKRYIDNNREMEEQCLTIKKESVTEWLKANTDRIQGLLDLCVELLPKKLKEASARDIVGAYKILSETSVNNVDNKPKDTSEDVLEKLCQEIREASNQ